MKQVKPLEATTSPLRTVVFGATAAAASLLILTGCVSTGTQTGESLAKTPEQLVDSYIKEKGAAIVTRVAHDRNTCSASQARLRRITGGKLDRQNFVLVEQVSAEIGASYLGALSRHFGAVLTMSSKESEQKADNYLKNNPISFAAIAPGNYVVTWIKCDYGNGSNIQLGADLPSLDNQENPNIAPIPGASHIVIRQGQIVDAGSLNIVVNTPNPDVPSEKTGKAEAIVTPRDHRNALKTEFPELHKRVRFTTFAPYKGTL